MLYLLGFLGLPKRTDSVENPEPITPTLEDLLVAFTFPEKSASVCSGCCIPSIHIIALTANNLHPMISLALKWSIGHKIKENALCNYVPVVELSPGLSSFEIKSLSNSGYPSI